MTCFKKPGRLLSPLPCATPSTRATQALSPCTATTCGDTHLGREVSSQCLSSIRLKTCAPVFLRSPEKERSGSDPRQVTGESYFSVYLINRMLSLELERIHDGFRTVWTLNNKTKLLLSLAVRDCYLLSITFKTSPRIFFMGLVVNSQERPSSSRNLAGLSHTTRKKDLPS